MVDLKTNKQAIMALRSSCVVRAVLSMCEALVLMSSIKIKTKPAPTKTKQNTIMHPNQI